MEFRRAEQLDIDDIMNIIKDAQLGLRMQGIDQWQNNYPNYETIAMDIEKQYSYIILKDKIIVGTVAVIFDGEESYNKIYDGKWLTNESYTTIHRIAVDSNYKGIGIGSIILEKVEGMSLKKDIKSIRVDTHEENTGMINFLKKNGFVYCGIIILQDGNKRIAFEKLL